MSDDDINMETLYLLNGLVCIITAGSSVFIGVLWLVFNVVFILKEEFTPMYLLYDVFAILHIYYVYKSKLFTRLK